MGIVDIAEKINGICSRFFGSDGVYYQSGERCSLFLYNNISEVDFRQALNHIDANKLFENQIDNNDFIFYQLDSTTVCLGYYRCNSSVRVVVDGESALPQYVAENYISNEQTTLWQFEVDHKLIDCGMCYIMRTCSGAFFIIDSAHTYSIRDCDRIHDFLRERTPVGEKIRIKGWFLSHGHDDHIAQFMNYIRYYMDDTVIEKVYHNIVSNAHRDTDNWCPASKKYVEMFYDLMGKHPEIPVCRLHTGMYFYADNIRFDVLCSHEDVFPESNENYNDSSVVLMMKADGTKVLFPGDAGMEESKILESRYPAYLKANIVQQAHHGHFGTSPEFYELVGAEVALFPVTQIKFDEELPNYYANQKSIDISKYYFIASNGTVEIPLPYKSGVFTVFPDETFESFSGVYNLWSYEYTKEYKEKLYNEYLQRGGKPLEEYKNGF